MLRTAQGRRMALGDKSLGWRPLVSGGIACRELAGTHSTIFTAAHVGVLARELLAARDAAT